MALEITKSRRNPQHDDDETLPNEFPFTVIGHFSAVQEGGDQLSFITQELSAGELLATWTQVVQASDRDQAERVALQPAFEEFKQHFLVSTSSDPEFFYLKNHYGYQIINVVDFVFPGRHSDDVSGTILVAGEDF